MFSSYDRWKLSSPPEWEGPFYCEECDLRIDESDVKIVFVSWQRQVCPDCYEKFTTEPG